MENNSVNSTDLNKILDKIKKLLALSTSPNEHEAHSALQMAQRLQAQYNINISEINMADEPDVIEYELNHGNTKTPSSNFKYIARYLAPHFRVKFVRSSTKSWAYGFSQDVQIFNEVLVYSYNCFNKMFKQFYKNSQLPFSHISRELSIRYKNDYLQGFVEGVLKALKDNEEKYALMVVVPNAVVEYTNKRTVMSRTTMKSVFGSAVARSQGFSDGQYSQNVRNVAITD